MRKSWESHVKVYFSTLAADFADMFVLVCSHATSPNKKVPKETGGPMTMALAFRQKAMVTRNINYTKQRKKIVHTCIHRNLFSQQIMAENPHKTSKRKNHFSSMFLLYSGRVENPCGGGIPSSVRGNWQDMEIYNTNLVDKSRKILTESKIQEIFHTTNISDYASVYRPAYSNIHQTILVLNMFWAPNNNEDIICNSEQEVKVIKLLWVIIWIQINTNTIYMNIS